MKRIKMTSRILMLIALVILGVLTIFLYKWNQDRSVLSISPESGIYGERVELVVNVPSKGTVYYTTDGSVPAPDNPKAQIYREPFVMEVKEEATAYSYQFLCLYEDGSQSQVHRRDYIIDSRGKERFTTKYIVSVTGDEDALFGYEEGIFVRGRQFDDYMEAHPDVDILNTVIPANYFSDEEQAVHAAFFLPDGTQIADRNCGLRIYGNITRAKNQKSFRLVARTQYDDLNEFLYPFMPKLVSQEGGEPIDAYQRLSFHNSGNDNGYAFIRTALVGELARQAGFPDVLAAESATVFVNGRYQGVYWLQNTFDDRYFNEKYGDYLGEFAVCEGALNHMEQEYVSTEQEQQAVQEYNAFCEWVETADLSREENWQRVQSTIDVTNFAQYMAIEYYVGNIDWPHNNVKIYRYMAAPGEEYAENSVYDGKYRYLLYDTDYGLGLKFQGWFGNSAEDQRLKELCEANQYSTVFGQLLEREEFRTLFINEVLCLMNTSFASINAEAAMVELNASRYEELRHMMEETDLLKNSLWEPDSNGIANVDEEMARILTFTDNRPATVATELQEQWGCGDLVVMEADLSLYQGLQINGAKVTANTEAGTFVGTYFTNIPLTLSWENVPGVVVDGYQVGNQFLEGQEVTIRPGEFVQEGNLLAVSAQIHVTEVESLEIARYHIRGSEDYVVLRNNGQVPVLLSDYTLVDTYDDLSKGQLPRRHLEPGEEYIVYGKEFTGSMQGGHQMAFGWATNEPVLLVHATRGIVDGKNLRWSHIEVPGT